MPMAFLMGWIMDALFSAPAQPKPDGIFFNNLRFSEPILFRWASPLAWSGLYAVLVFDPACSPRPYRVIYFGQGGDLSSRVTTAHEKYSAWYAAAGGHANLYVAFHWLPTSTESQRVSAESALVREYKPQCNVVFNPLASLFFGGR